MLLLVLAGMASAQYNQFLPGGRPGGTLFRQVRIHDMVLTKPDQTDRNRPDPQQTSFTGLVLATVRS